MNNIKVFAREGAPNWIILQFIKKNEIYTARDEIEKVYLIIQKKIYLKSLVAVLKLLKTDLIEKIN